jgi:YrbI family 3-deoxy-D-manno-octulosonate 8-phosphate phosphatase
MKLIYEKIPPFIKKKLSDCKLLILDFDGTLTDNKVYISENNIEMVMADRGDGMGIELLKNNTSVKIIILSKETNPVTSSRAKKLNIPCKHGLNNKYDSFILEANKNKLNFSQIIFVGNDLNDIKCIKKAGLGIAVKDSYSQVLEVADYITTRKGGNGAVREVCELILYAKNKHPYF